MREKPKITKQLLLQALKMGLVAVFCFDLVLSLVSARGLLINPEFAIQFPYYMLSCTILGFVWGFIGCIILEYKPE
jgi:hypothetical protein